MKKLFYIVCIVMLLAVLLSACTDNPPSGTNAIPSETNTSDGTMTSNPNKGETTMNNEILVVYFSCTDTTKTIADYIIEKTRGTGYRI